VTPSLQKVHLSLRPNFRTGCLLTIIICTTALSGWICDIPVLRSFGTQIKSMSPVSGIFFLTYAILLFYLKGVLQHRMMLRLYGIAGAIGTALSVLFVVITLRNIDSLTNHQGATIDKIVASAPLMSMSPVTACCFLLISISFLFHIFPIRLHSPSRVLLIIPPGFVAITGSILSVAYFLGGPLFYETGIIPPSFPSSLAFIALATALLSSALPHPGAPHQNGVEDKIAGRPFPSVLLPVLILSSAGILFAGYLYFIDYRDGFLSDVEKRLSTIADLKVEGLVQWRNERMGDAAAVYKNKSFSWLLKNVVDNPAKTEMRQLLLSWINVVATTFNYDEISLFDTSGVIFCDTKETSEKLTPEKFSCDLATFLQKKESMLCDLHRDRPGQPIHMTIIAPVFENGGKERLLGLIAFRINPKTFLYPYLQQWPSTDLSAEVLLVRREGDDVVYLNNLKYHDNAALNFRMPLKKSTLPAAMAVLGKTGIVKGYDYRNIEVMAALRSIPDSPWYLVARIDKSEIDKPLLKHLWMTAGIIILLFFILSIGVGALWLYRRSRYFQEKLIITEALTRSEALLRTIFDNVRDGIAAIDSTTRRCVVANDSLCRQLGRSESELPDLNAEDFLPAECSTILFDRSGTFDNGTTHLFAEIPVTRKNGSVIYTDISAAAVDLDGKKCVLGVFRDVTERKKANEKIGYHEDLLRQMGKMAKIGGWEFDAVTGKATWTEEVAQIHELYPTEEIKVNDGLGFYHGVSRIKIEQAVHDAVASGKEYDLELELVSAKGIHKWVHTIGQPVVENGKVVKVRGSFQDVTYLKLTEAHIIHLNNVLRGIRNVNKLITHEKDRDRLLRQICDQLVETRGFHSAIIVLTDSNNGKVVAVADTGMQLTESYKIIDKGVLPGCCRNALANHGVVVMKKPEDSCIGCPGCAQATAEVMTCRLEHVDRILGFILVSLPAEMSADPEEQALLKELAGDIAFALHGIEVEAEQARSAAALATSEQQLRQAQKLEAIGQLAGGIAHDFNNIISAIMGYCDLIPVELISDGAPAEHIRQIMKCSERAAGLTRQLLTFSRKQVFNPVVVNLNTVIANLHNMLNRLIGEDIELILHLDEHLGLIKADPNQMEQVLMNLIVNSRDAMPDGGKLIIETANITLDENYSNQHISTTPGNYTMLAVSDTGHGIEASVRERIFEPFFTTKEHGKGTGLGLSTVYGIVTQTGGNIWCYSEPGKGTTFKMYFPPTSDIAPKEQLDTITLENNLCTETLLIAEDEDTVRDVAYEMLVKSGYTVIAAANGQEALNACSGHNETIHLLITDIIMPGMNGKELAECIRKIHPETKVLYTSGYTDNVIAHHGILEHGTAFLQKPYNRLQLLSKVRDILES
jgi:PAS domain S-box-containing protein